MLSISAFPPTLEEYYFDVVLVVSESPVDIAQIEIDCIEPVGCNLASEFRRRAFEAYHLSLLHFLEQHFGNYAYVQVVAVAYMYQHQNHIAASYYYHSQYRFALVNC